MQLRLLFLFSFLIGSLKGIFAQNVTPSVVNSTGASQVQVGNVWLEIAVGEVATSTIGSITQGVLQPRYTIGTPTIDLSKGQQIRVFPNPVIDVLYIETNNITVSQLQVVDVSGRILLRETNTPLSISVKNLVTGAYFLQIFTVGSTVPVTTSFIKN